jgi:poly-gamma-glutamate capsule biosynthesis protein CapA/YwtB (metallophosphatase superfamily)
MATTGVAGDTRMDDRTRLRLFLAGDVMTGRGVDQILPHPSDPGLHEDYVKDARDYVRLAERVSGPIARPVGFDYVWGEALAQWQAYRPDLRLINLETSVTTSQYHWQWKGIHYRMHPDNVDCLAAAQPDCCLLANNHVLDWGYAGLMETLTTLYRARLSFAGAGANLEEAARPARLTVPGKARVLVHAFAEGESGVPGSWAATADRAGINRLRDLDGRTADRIARSIAAERDDGDIVVVSIHWGGNWGYDVPPAQRRFAHRLIDSGAVDLVFGHSPHHARAIECYEGRLIIYGSGDFITDYEGIRGHEYYRPWLSPMYFVDLDPATGLLERLQIVPLRLQRFRLTAASTEDRSWLLEQLNRASRDFDTVLEPRDGALVVDACATA